MKTLSVVLAALVGSTTLAAQPAVDQAIPRITEAAPTAPAAKPKKARKLLVFAVTRGYRHRSIPVAKRALAILGERSGAYEAVVSDDLDNFRPERLAAFDAVCFVNTTGPIFASEAQVNALKPIAAKRSQLALIQTVLDGAGTRVDDATNRRIKRVLGLTRTRNDPLTVEEIRTLKSMADKTRADADAAQKAYASAHEADRKREETLRESLLSFIRNGGGFVGIHSATDVYHRWQPYADMIGGRFCCHPWTANCRVSIRNEEPAHPVNAGLERRFAIQDEIYQVDEYSADKVRVLLRLDTLNDRERLTGIRGTRNDDDYAVTWLRRYGEGRVFYCSLGHNDHIYWDRRVLRHYLAGIQFALGDLEADATPTGPYRDPLVSDPKDYDVDAFMGTYPGTFTPKSGRPTDGVASVIARGDAQYEIALVTQGGARTVHPARRTKNALVVGEPAIGKLEKRTLVLDLEHGSFEGRHEERRSPTLGASPPPGAVVLLPFDASAPKPPSLGAWINKRWKPLADGSVRVTKGSNLTEGQFADVRLHVEFRIPFEPKKRGQGRGNSGVYLMNRYEVQVLDSFGLDSQPNDCGAIYSLAKPRVNACLPPLRWQTYDIDFRVARFAADGEAVTALPRVTVRHNGVLIHEDVEIARPTAGGGKKNHGTKGPLLLQDHTNPLQYRNMWLVERKPETDAPRR